MQFVISKWWRMISSCKFCNGFKLVIRQWPFFLVKFRPNFANVSVLFCCAVLRVINDTDILTWLPSERYNFSERQSAVERTYWLVKGSNVVAAAAILWRFNFICRDVTLAYTRQTSASSAHLHLFAIKKGRPFVEDVDLDQGIDCRREHHFKLLAIRRSTRFT